MFTVTNESNSSTAPQTAPLMATDYVYNPKK